MNADSASLTFRAWDQTTGSAGTKVDVSVNGGATAFSTATETAAITVTAVNDAPGTPGLGFSLPILEDATNSSLLVSQFADFFWDNDTGALKGMAVTGVDNTHGTWQYTLNGSDWFAIGNVSDTSARLLPSDATARFRFVPDADWNGVTGMFSYKAWDQTTGTAGTLADVSVNGGTTAFAAGCSGASLAVSAVNDAPTATAASVTLDSVAEDTVNPAGASVLAVRRHVQRCGDQVTGGSRPIISPARRSSPTPPAPNAGQVAVVQRHELDGREHVRIHVQRLDTCAKTLVRFLPNTNYNGSPGTLTVRLIDDSAGAVTSGGTVNVGTGGGTTQYSSAANAGHPGNEHHRVSTSAGHHVPGHDRGDGKCYLIADRDQFRGCRHVREFRASDVDGQHGKSERRGRRRCDGRPGRFGLDPDGLDCQPQHVHRRRESHLLTAEHDVTTSLLRIILSDLGNSGSELAQEETAYVDLVVTPVNDAPVASDHAGHLLAEGAGGVDAQEHGTVDQRRRCALRAR